MSGIKMPIDPKSILYVNKKRKYGDEIRMAAFDMFCEGKGVSEIAKELKMHHQAIQRLKNQNWPESWAEARLKRVEAKTKKIEEEALEKFENVQARLQKTWRAVSNAAAGKLIRAAQANTLDDDIALEALVAAGKEELKLYLPLDQQFQQNQISVGAFAKPTGEIGVIAALNQVFERVNGPDKPDPESA